MGKRKPKTENAYQIESKFFKELKQKFDDKLGPGFYTKKEVLDFLDEFYRFNL